MSSGSRSRNAPQARDAPSGSGTKREAAEVIDDGAEARKRHQADIMNGLPRPERVQDE